MDVPNYDLKYFRNIFFGLLTAILFSCGGGSSGSGSNEERGVLSLTYQGKTDLAVINRQNTIPLVDSVFRVFEPAYWLSTAIYSQYAYIQAPFLLNYETTSGPEDCESGSLDVRRSNNDRNISLIYNQCRLGDIVSDGVIDYTFDEEGNRNGSMQIDHLRISRSTDVIEITASVELNPEQLTVRELTLSSRTLEQMYHSSNLSIDRSGNFSGALQHSEFGEIQVTYENWTRSLLIEGDQLSTAEISFDIGRYVSGVRRDELTILFFVDKNDRENFLSTTMPITSLFSWPYSENKAPDAIVPSNLSVDRLAALSISGTESTDGDYDFLTYSWRHLSAPENCDYSLTNESSADVEFMSACQGTHQLQINVYDGFDTAEYNFPIEVIPLPAEIGDIATQLLSTNSSLELSVPIINEAEDGPFSFRLSYAPRGIEVTQNGIVSGVPIPFLMDQTSTFNIGVEVDNGRSTLASFSVQLENEDANKKLISGSDLCARPFLRWSDIDGNGHPDLVCPLHNSYIVYEKVGEVINSTYVELSPRILGGLTSITQSDFSGDELPEIILGYGQGVLVVDGRTKEVVREFLFEEENTEGSGQYKLYSTGQNTDQKGFLLTSARSYRDLQFEKTYYFSSELSEPLVVDNHSITAVGDVDGDGLPEIIARNELFSFSGYDNNFPKTLTHLVDYDGDGLDELLSFSGNNTENDYFSDGFILESYDPRTGELLFLDELVYPHDLPEGESVYGASAGFVNIDEDPEKEIFMAFGNESLISRLFVFEFDGERYSFDRQLNLPSNLQWFFNSNLVPQLSRSEVYLYAGSSLSYSKQEGFIELSHSQPEAYFISGSTRALSKPFVQSDNSLRVYYTNRAFEADVGSMNVSQEGFVTGYSLLSGIEAPHTMDSLGEFQASNFGAKIVLAPTPPSSEFQGFRIYDGESTSLLAQTVSSLNTTWPARIFSGDINNDLEPDILVESSSNTQGIATLSWLDIENEEVLWELTDPNSDYYTGARLSRVSDINLDGTSELLTLLSPRRSESDGEFRVYQFVEGVPTLVHSISVLGSESFGVQDIDGDGKKEIVIKETQQGYCESTTLQIIDDNFEMVREIVVDGCVDSIPSLDFSAAKNNIIVSMHFLDRDVWFNRKQYSYYSEVDPINGETIWNSSLFFGRLMDGDVSIVGDDPYLSPKAAVYAEGLYIFQ